MIDDNLIQLSFEQLEEIQTRISQVILEKKSARIADAIKDVLNFLNTHYVDVSLWDFLNELADTYQDNSMMTSPMSTGLEQSGELGEMDEDCLSHDWSETCLEMPSLALQVANLNHQATESSSELELEAPISTVTDQPSALVEPEDIRLLYDPGVFYERLRVIKNEALQHEDTRLLWLTNDGSQKTSKLSGKALAEVLQETIKKLERLCDTDHETEMSIEDLNREILRISEWSEFHLGVSLRKGTLTIITPFAARDVQINGSTSRLTIAEMCQQSNKGKLHIPFS